MRALCWGPMLLGTMLLGTMLLGTMLQGTMLQGSAGQGSAGQGSAGRGSAGRGSAGRGSGEAAAAETSADPYADPSADPYADPSGDPDDATGYSRPVTAAPQPDDIGDGYQVPHVQHAPPRSVPWHLFDVALLTSVMGLTALACHWKRRRAIVAGLSVASLAYFGFIRQGCVCAIGSIQNASAAMVEPHSAIPWVVVAFFVLPLGAALVWGRVFCGAACPLGAIQDVVLLRPVQLPLAVDRWGGMVRYIYLGAAVWFAMLPLSQRDFVICRYDPFVGIFRLQGTAIMIGAGVALLAIATVVGRPYCRFLCPYGGLLGVVSRFAFFPVQITPDRELDCGLCAEACPFGAIENLRADRRRCLACARCFASCPRQRVAWGEMSEIDAEALVDSARKLAVSQEATR